MIDWQSQLTGEPKPKCHVISLDGECPNAQPDNQKMELLGDTGYRRYHMHDVVDWLTHIDNGYECLDDTLKTYIESTDDEENTIYTFDADTTADSVLAVLTGEDETEGFVVLSGAEWKAVKATTAWVEQFTTDDDT